MSRQEFTPQEEQWQQQQQQQRLPQQWQEQCTIATFNCCLSVCPPLRFNGAFARARRLVDAVYSCISSKDLDIICLQEIVVFRDDILKQFIHHPFHSDIVESSLFGNNIRIMHAGLTTVSKWPIEEEDAHVFAGKTYNAEAFMAKAVQYTKIRMHNRTIVHVFNLHLQAWTNANASEIRREQIRQTKQFMLIKLKCSDLTRELVCVAGDLNVDMYEHAALMDELIAELGMSFVMPTTPQFSFDPSVNELVGSDDASEYALRSQVEGCYEAFLETGVCPCAPKQMIDGIAFLNSQLERKLIHHAVTNVVPILSRAPFEIMINMSTRRSVQTISDHFSVVTQFHYHVETQHNDDVHIDVKPTTKKENNFRAKRHLGWIVFEIILFLAILFFFWLVYAFGRWLVKKARKK